MRSRHPNAIGRSRSEQPALMVTRKIRQDGNKEGILVYGYKFRPVMQ